MKKLFVLVSDGGDGSFYPCYTFDEGVIAFAEELSEKDVYAEGPGFDGDGFHYDVLMVHDDFTIGQHNSLVVEDSFWWEE